MIRYTNLLSGDRLGAYSVAGGAGVLEAGLSWGTAENSGEGRIGEGVTNDGLGGRKAGTSILSEIKNTGSFVS
jgi:hypothetical protein